MATLDIKYLCNPTDGTPGPAFDAFEVDAMNAASKGDKRGYSVADTWLGIDEGGSDPRGHDVQDSWRSVASRRAFNAQALTCVDSRQGGSVVAQLRAQAPLACPYHTHMTDPSPMDETDLPPYRWQV